MSHGLSGSSVLALLEEVPGGMSPQKAWSLDIFIERAARGLDRWNESTKDMATQHINWKSFCVCVVGINHS